jgi:multidrug efflux pump subunit AcrA (membrane-fusion protein)
MKIRGIIGVLLLGLILTGATACGGGDEETAAGTVINDINVTVTGDGNIEASSHERLTFGSGGKVANISVKEGDMVSKGDVLASLDPGALELAEARAQVALTQAQVALTQAQVALTQAQAAPAQAELAEQTAEQALENTRDTETTLELALANAQIAVRTAGFNLEKTSDLYTWSDIKTAKADADDARRYLDELLAKVGLFLPEDEDGQYPSIQEYIDGEDFFKGSAWESWQRELVHAQARLNTAEDRLDAMLAGSDAEAVAIKRLQMEAAEKAEAQARNNLAKLGGELAIKALEVELAKESVEQARQNIELARQNVDLAQQNIILSQKSLEQARKYLGEATIVALFDGMVANIGVKEGAFLSPAAYAGTTIIELIDPRHMELTARVDELDVVKVKTGQKVIIGVDALPGTRLEGRVTHISPVAREPVGVVLFEDEDEAKEYEVRIDFGIPANSPIRVGMSATAEIIVK